MNEREAKIEWQGRYARILSHDGWEYAERVTPGGAVVIVALTDDRKLLFVEQYRVPMGGLTIELPAGLVGDEPGSEREDVLVAAHRELLEETGYRAHTIEKLFHGPSSPGFSSEQFDLVRARSLVREHQGVGVDGENITVHAVALDGAHHWLVERAAHGYAVDPKVFLALHFLSLESDR